MGSPLPVFFLVVVKFELVLMKCFFYEILRESPNVEQKACK